MLVLSRKEGERLVIGDNITLIVSKVVGNRVTIGIEAPKDIKVMRSELADSDASESKGRVSVGKVVYPTASFSLKDFASTRTLQRQVG